MSIKEIIEHFDERDKLWIDVNDVRDLIVRSGYSDEINFHFVDVNEAILRGCLHRYNRRPGVYSDPLTISDILIAKTLDPEWRRLVAVKELLHITDTAEYSAESKDAVDKLLINIAMPFEVQEITKSAANDHVQIIHALAVLVPLKCRVKLRDLFANNKITTDEVADLARIPGRFSELIVQDEFERLLEMTLKMNGG